MRKAYSYIRMSTDIQLKGDSLRRQLELSKKYANENNLELVDSINDVKLYDIGVSAFKGKNSQDGTLSIFLECIDQGLIEEGSVLLVESLDRLSRNKIGDALTQFLSIINKGIEIITLADNQRYTKEIINDNPGPLFLSLVIMFRANEESEIKSKRLKAAWSNKRNQAIDSKKPLTKTLPSWLTLDENNQFIIDKKKADVVRQIFTLCASTTGIFGITRYLNESKVPTFNDSKYWHQSYVNKILNNRSVLGEFQPHHYVAGKRSKLGEAIKNYFPSIINEEEFNNAHAAINRRTNNKGRKGNTFSNILSGLVYCVCGDKMTLQNKGNRKSDKFFTCYSKKFKAGCQNDDWILSETIELFFKHLKEINFDEVLKSDNKELNLSNLIFNLEQQNIKLNNDSSKLLELTLADDLNSNSKKILIEKLNAIENKKNINEEEINKLKIELEEQIVSKQSFNEENIKTIIEKLNSSDDYMFRATINTTLSKFIERITLHPAPIFAPEEFNDTDREVIEYKKTHPKLKLNEIIQRETFKRMCKKMNRVMMIKYKFGTSRMIQGDGLTYYGEYKPLQRQ